MAQCDVFDNEAASRAYAPYLLDVQANLLRDLDTRVVVPLVTVALFGRRIRNLHPLLKLDGDEFVMATHLLAAVSAKELRRKRGNLDGHRSIIISAVDVVLSGV